MWRLRRAVVCRASPVRPASLDLGADRPCQGALSLPRLRRPGENDVLRQACERRKDRGSSPGLGANRRTDVLGRPQDGLRENKGEVLTSREPFPKSPAADPEGFAFARPVPCGGRSQPSLIWRMTMRTDFD